MTKINCPRCVAHATIAFINARIRSVQTCSDLHDCCAHHAETGEDAAGCPYLQRAVEQNLRAIGRVQAAQATARAYPLGF